MSKHQELLQAFRLFAETAANTTELMTHISQRLHSELARYNWVGFYLVDKTRPSSLNLGPHVGSFDPHESVSLDKGLCGDAAATKKTVVVNNAAADPRYKSSSALVKSEMVVPIFTRGTLYGVIDINSYFADTFNYDEQQFVGGCAELVSGYLEKPR